MTTASDRTGADLDLGVVSEAEALTQLTAAYRQMNPAERRRVARRANPENRGPGPRTPRRRTPRAGRAGPSRGSPAWTPPDRMDAAVHALTELAAPASAPTGSGSYDDQQLAGRR
ncbi:hypothetical protein [Streptomyces sp. WAC01280]|uniref:hypothetical protein n=1 Tax=Streptomyces sp. WAC01280 TaxID=2487424 RepID=UPI00163BA2E7|nr:hypothetical protein [Streptomyces sp. WAC01280]